MGQPLFLLLDLEAPVTDARLFIIIIIFFVIIDAGVINFVISDIGLNVTTASVVPIIVPTTIFVVLPF